MRIVILIVALSACGRSSERREPYLVGSSICVDVSDTDESPQQTPSPDSVPGCKTWPRYERVSATVQGMCGPCGFAFDKPTTTAERSRHPNACCYTVSSPPPPPPPEGAAASVDAGDPTPNKD